MLNKKYTGKVIKAYIELLGLTYEELAYKVGLTSPRVVYDWVDGLKMPSTERLYTLAELFNIKIDDKLEKHVILINRGF